MKRTIKITKHPVDPTTGAGLQEQSEVRADHTNGSPGSCVTLNLDGVAYSLSPRAATELAHQLLSEVEISMDYSTRHVSGNPWDVNPFSAVEED